MSVKIGIAFGAMAPRIEEQLPPTVKIKRMDLIHLQKDADAVTRLRIHDILTESQSQSARKKVMKKILRAAIAKAEGKI